jgi:hypothetical protein
MTGGKKKKTRKNARSSRKQSSKKSRKQTIGRKKTKKYSKTKHQKGGKKHMKNSRRIRKSRKHKQNKQRKHQKGGYHQYMSNIPHSAQYGASFDVTPSTSMLANPGPIQKLNTCVDNYNHYTGKGFETGVYDQAPQM